MDRVQRDADRFLHPLDRLRSCRLGDSGAGRASPYRRLRGQGRERAICRLLLPIRGFAWLFLACLFVANVSFNNLGFPVLSMAFNWARATLGTIPFVTVGARYGGVQGGMLGFALGAAVFGLIAVATAYAVTWRLAKAMDGADRAVRGAASIERRGAKTR